MKTAGAEAGLRSCDEVAIGDADFVALATLVRREIGLNLTETKRPLIQSRLSKRLKNRSIRRFSEYLDMLSDPREENERRELVTALTTNVTSFFREKHHFETLSEKLLPSITAGARRGQRVRFWSAGCSTGEEPYSLAMTILEAFPNAVEKNVKILATDIDPRVIEQARAGRYGADEIEALPDAIKKKYFKGMSTDAREFGVTEPLRRLVTFAELNLMAQWPFKGPFDAIFCRNVAIYFDRPTQEELWARFASCLRPGGLLFIGHSERLTGSATAELTPLGTTSFRKTDKAGDQRSEKWV